MATGSVCDLQLHFEVLVSSVHLTVPKGGWEPSDKTLEAAASREAFEEGQSSPSPQSCARSPHLRVPQLAFEDQ